MKRWILFSIAFLALLFIGRKVLVPKIVERGFQNLVAENVGTDTTANLEDGLHVYICGAGSPLPDPQRSGPCIGVLAGEQAFIFDAGTNGARNLGPMGFPTGQTETIFLTHLHSDHIDGLGELLLGTWINGGRTSPTPVFGPVGTAQIVDGFNTAYKIDSIYRTAHHGADTANPNGFGAVATEIDFPGHSGVVFSDGGVAITAFNVNHSPVEPAFGYRIDYKDRSIVISGDTVFDINVVKQSKDVDVLLHEALNAEMVSVMQAAAEKNGSNRLAKILHDIQDYHTSPVNAARAAKASGAKALVLYHIVPMLPNDALISVFLKGTAKEYSGKITVAKDGTIIRLPIDSTSVIYENGLSGF